MKKALSQLKKRKMLKVIVGVGIIAIIILVGAGIYFQVVDGKIYIDKSVIQTPIIVIAPSLQGKVQEIAV